MTRMEMDNNLKLSWVNIFKLYRCLLEKSLKSNYGLLSVRKLT